MVPAIEQDIFAGPSLDIRSTIVGPGKGSHSCLFEDTCSWGLEQSILLEGYRAKEVKGCGREVGGGIHLNQREGDCLSESGFPKGGT
jgi:hypothetical protein